MMPERIGLVREAVCADDGCIEHGGGTVGCPIPTEHGVLVEYLDERGEDGLVNFLESGEEPEAGSLQDLFEPDIASGKVVYEDGTKEGFDGDEDVPEPRRTTNERAADLDKQPVPSDAACPACGGRPEHNPNHVLSATGYTHDDIKHTCRECDHEWPSGVPIGEYEGELAEELFCDSCEKRYMLVHRIRPRSAHAVTIHLKCPNDECYYFDKIRREADDNGLILMGYPQITGSTEGASPWGYEE